MNSRQKTFAALKRENAHYIPVDFWATQAVKERIERESGFSYEQFLDHYDVDLRYIDGPEYIGPSLKEGIDIWGVSRGSVTAAVGDQAETYTEVTRPPLADFNSVEEIENYSHWPDPDWYDYSVIKKQCERVLAKDRVTVFMGDRINRIAQLKPAMYLRGTEEILMDIALNEDIAAAIFRKIREFYLVYLQRILEAADGKIDIILTGDDFGAQNGLLLSPDMWRGHLKPGFAEYIGLIKSHNILSMHHTCGSVVPLINDMIECGLDILQSIQPEAADMSLSKLKAEFGDKISFQGGMSIQQTVPFGTPEEIRREVKDIADIIQTGGGYIFCTSHNIQADTSMENIRILMEAYKEFRIIG